MDVQHTTDADGPRARPEQRPNPPAESGLAPFPITQIGNPKPPVPSRSLNFHLCFVLWVSCTKFSKQGNTARSTCQTGMTSTRPKKTDIVRKRTGCQRCRAKRRQVRVPTSQRAPSKLTRLLLSAKCDETRPECLACVQRGVSCGGYQTRIRFKDVSDVTAEASKKVEAARWSALRAADSERSQANRRSGFGNHQQRLQPRQGESEGDGPLLTRSPILFEDGDVNEQHGEPHRQRETSIPALEELPPCLEAPIPIIPNDQINQRADGRSASEIDDGHEGTIDITAWHRTPSPSPSRYDILNIVSMADMDSDGPSWNPTIDAPTEPGPSQQPAAALAWEDLLIFPNPSRAPTPAPARRLIAAASSHIARVIPSTPSPSEDELLAAFSREIAPRITMQLPYDTLCSVSSAFRAAALSLAAAHYAHAHTHSNGSKSPSDTSCHYYDFAVADLDHQISRQHPQPQACNALVGTVMLLIHRDFVVGSQIDIYARLRQLEAISNAIDVSEHCAPSLLKAWYMLAFDMRLRLLPTRKTTAVVGGLPPLHVYGQWDTQVTIRDIHSSLWRLHCRAVIESSCPESDDGIQPEAHSASRRAVQWLCSVLGRRCDRRQWEQGDYHDKSLSVEAITAQVSMFESRLDVWHRSIAREDIPVPSLDACSGDVMAGPSYGAIVPYSASDRHKGMDYGVYLVSRMICLYLQSSYGPRGSWSNNAVKIEAMARIVLGITLNMGPSVVSEHDALTMTYMVAMLAEGAAIASAVLEALLPKWRKGMAGTTADRVAWLSIESLMRTIIRERHAGRSIRFIIDCVDEDERGLVEEADRRRVVFGDIGGRGYFRDVIGQ